MPDREFSVAIIGAGKLARALVPALRSAKIPIRAVAARRLAASGELALAPGTRRTRSPEIAAAAAPVVLLAVPDRELPGLVRRLAASPRIDWTRRVILHHAGACGIDLLAPLAREGAGVGLLHPMQTLGATPRASVALRGSACRIEGDARGRIAAGRLANALGLVPLPLASEIDADSRAAYHAAASLVANDFVALFALAARLLESLAIPHDVARAALFALARGTLEQLQTGGIAGALTGPASRGDLATVRAQVHAVSRSSRAGGAAHAWLAVELAGLAERAGRSDTKALRRALVTCARRIGRARDAGL